MIQQYEIYDVNCYNILNNGMINNVIQNYPISFIIVSIYWSIHIVHRGNYIHIWHTNHYGLIKTLGIFRIFMLFFTIFWIISSNKMYGCSLNSTHLTATLIITLITNYQYYGLTIPIIDIENNTNNMNIDNNENNIQDYFIWIFMFPSLANLSQLKQIGSYYYNMTVLIFGVIYFVYHFFFALFVCYLGIICVLFGFICVLFVFYLCVIWVYLKNNSSLIIYKNKLFFAKVFLVWFVCYFCFIFVLFSCYFENNSKIKVK